MLAINDHTTYIACHQEFDKTPKYSVHNLAYFDGHALHNTPCTCTCTNIDTCAPKKGKLGSFLHSMCVCTVLGFIIHYT